MVRSALSVKEGLNQQGFIIATRARRDFSGCRKSVARERMQSKTAPLSWLSTNQSTQQRPEGTAM
ncbi:hypothetical protein DBR00_06920 [Pseudomonas sp. HMWF032]|nr:hypothetical protein DBR00_06920 [Pseudomonas sp. HMWF032]PTT72183.1 hypothetical protein DBR41_29790 [Pseudomonas sp. HMWF010]